MGKLIILITTFVGVLAFSQELKYEEVVHVDSSATKEELYKRARTYLSKNFKDEGELFTIEDKDDGELTGSGRVRYYTKKIFVGALCTIGYVNFKINVYPKDGRYKYVIHSLVHEGTDCRKNSAINYGLLTLSDKPDKSKDVFLRKGPWQDIKEKTDLRMIEVISGLKEAMNKQHETSKDW
ncbi:DUF4468 domain-containing protein [Chryseobacterium sp. HR92]|uniref:DUF4468 domain-containing protein n=1 Tax=Chryseobacterium sp. HR92 TaxID=3094839 RepID=UPI00388E90EA|nr:DUF4468 domain-containing protein [Chryseobacterium sp. HR92]